MTISVVSVMKSAVETELLELLAVYQSAGWWDVSTEDYRQINTIIHNSFCFTVARIDNRIVGMARSISDGLSDAYIQDVAVLPEYKGSGIGKLLVEKIIEFLQDNKITWIGLIATPGADKFYKKLGFSIMENFTPMILKKG